MDGTTYVLMPGGALIPVTIIIATPPAPVNRKSGQERRRSSAKPAPRAFQTPLRQLRRGRSYAAMGAMAKPAEGVRRHVSWILDVPPPHRTDPLARAD